VHSVPTLPELCPKEYAADFRSSAAAASRKSACSTMSYRLKTFAVLCPDIFMATDSATPALRRLRTPVLRKS